MLLANTATLRFSLYEFTSVRINEVEKLIRPENAIKRAWIPQTLGEQIWVWYEFNTAQEKEKFLEDLPTQYKSIKGFIATGFTQKDLDNYTK